MSESGVNFFTADSVPYGKTYGAWTVQWWRWALSGPKSTSPVLDELGKYAHLNQPSEVWFLAGKFGDEQKDIPYRKVTVPSRTSLLFPIINCEANAFEYPELRTDEDLLDHVKRDENTIVKKECFVDGEKIPVQRVSSDPPIFDLEIAKDNPLGIMKTGTTRAAADGYWVFLKPLDTGEHRIEFAGACELGRLNSGASYQIMVK